MPFPDEFDDPTADDAARPAVLRRLDALMADPIRQEFADPEVVDYIDRQRDRLTDARGAPVGGEFEPFEPAVQRSDIRLESPVGPGEANHPMAVFNAKKLLNTAGFHDFAPGIEPFSEASPRFLADLRRFQTAHDLAPDATAQPGGPTVHMLTRKVFGTADGPPPDSEREHFEERFAKDPNRTLSGQPIFGEAGFIEASDTGIQEAARRGGRRRRGGSVPDAKQRKKSARERIKEKIDESAERGLKTPRTRKKRAKEDSRGNPIVDTPVPIFRYPDGRLYVAVDERGRIAPRSEPGSIKPQDLDTSAKLSGIRDAWNIAYPDLQARRTFQQRRAAGVESYVYGEVVNKSGQTIRYEILIDPRSGEPLRAPVGEEILLSRKQLRKMGLDRWLNPQGR